ncbi:MAG: AI-2E family transporter [Thermoanaerobaculia bacterium]
MNTAVANDGGGRRLLVTAAAAVIVIAGMKAAAPILVPLMLALFITLVSFPLLEWLRTHGWPRSLASAATLVVDALVLTAFGFLVARAVDQFVEAAPEYLERIKQIARGSMERLSSFGLLPPEWVDPERIGLPDVLDLARVVVGRTFAGVTSTFLFATFVLLYMLFMLGEAQALPDKLDRAFGSSLAGSRRMHRFVRDVQRYLLVKTWLNLILAVLVWIWLVILKVDFALLWAILSFLLHYIPNLGIILAAVPPAVQALIQHNPGRLLLVVLGFLVVGVVLGNLVEPQIMGRRFGFSSLVVLISLVFFGWIWGPVGALLSVPLLVVLRVLSENSDDCHWLAVLLGRGRPVSAPHAP